VHACRLAELHAFCGKSCWKTSSGLVWHKPCFDTELGTSDLRKLTRTKEGTCWMLRDVEILSVCGAPCAAAAAVAAVAAAAAWLIEAAALQGACMVTSCECRACCRSISRCCYPAQVLLHAVFMRRPSSRKCCQGNSYKSHDH